MFIFTTTSKLQPLDLLLDVFIYDFKKKNLLTHHILKYVDNFIPIQSVSFIILCILFHIVKNIALRKDSLGSSMLLKGSTNKKKLRISKLCHFNGCVLFHCYCYLINMEAISNFSLLIKTIFNPMIYRDPCFCPVVYLG